MEKTLKPSGTMTRNEYLTLLGTARYGQPYGQPSGVKPLGTSSSSKQLKGGDCIEKVNENEGKGNAAETGG